MKEDKNNQKLYMKWWFWVIIGLMFISVILAIMPYPDSCDEIEDELTECEEDLSELSELMSELLDALDEQDKALEDYCAVDRKNPLCDVLL